MAKCPNINLKDWSDLVDKFGKDGAYYIFMKNGETVPYLQGREQNQFIWNVENELKLLNWKSDNGKRTKLYKGFSRDKAADLVKQIRENYVGNYIIKYVAPDTKGEYGIKIEGYPLPRKAVEEFAKETQADANDTMATEEAYKNYQEFKRREEEANEDILPINHISSSDILYNSESRNLNSSTERFQEQQQSELETILLSTLPQVSEVKYDNKLESKGVLEPGNVIRVNPETMTKDTVGHEFGHLLIDLRGGLSDSFVVDGIEQLEGTPMAKKVRETYADRTEEYIKKEILATAIGMEVADIFDRENNQSKFEIWLNRFFRWLMFRTGLTKNNARKLANDLLKGKPLDSSKYTGKQSVYSQESVPLGDITEEEDVTFEKDPEGDYDFIKPDRKLLDEYQKIRQKATNIITTRISKAQAGGRAEELSELRALLYELQEEHNRDKNAIFQFVANSASFINREYSIYETKQKKLEAGDNEAFKLQDLSRWNDLMSSYDILDDVVNLLTNENFLGTEGKIEGKIFNRMKRKLQEIVAKKNDLKSQYRLKGNEMNSNVLKRYSGKVSIEVKNLKMKEWRENNKNHGLSRAEAKKKQEDYADTYMKKNINAVIEDTKTLLLTEMDLASEDVGKVTAWLDNMLDTNDAVMGAAVKLIVLKDSETRVRSVEFKNKAWSLVKKLYKESGYVYGSTNVADVYSFMLETNKEGKRTGYFINKHISEMDKERERIKLSHAHLPYKDAAQLNYSWENENNPLDIVEYNKALRIHMETLISEHRMTEEDMQKYFLSQEIPYAYRPKLYDVFDIDSIEAANDVMRWIRVNKDTYRNPIEKWVNPKWAAFEKFLKDNPKSAQAEFYNLITDTLTNLNSELPHDKRKTYQLPFLLKDSVERYTDGQPVGKTLKEGLKDMTQRRLDDIERGQYTDENDKPIDFLPYYYNRSAETHEHIVTYKLVVNEDRQKLAEARGKEFKTHTRTVKANTAEEAISKTMLNVVGVDVNSIKVTHSKSIEWNDADQSYDLMNLYTKYHTMADRFVTMRDILPEIDHVMYISKQRDYTKKDANGNIIRKALGKDKVGSTVTKGVDANLPGMMESFVKSTMFGQTKIDEGSWDIMGWKLDKAKMVDGLGKYAAYNMLGLNLIQGISNVSMGELQQVTEAIAGEFITLKDLHTASIQYGKEMGVIMGDVGEVTGESVITHLNEQFNILNEYEGGTYKENSKFARLMKTSSLFFISNIGEHFMQTRVMLAMLNNVKAKNSKGEDIGTIYEHYSVKDGQLVLSDKVDRVKSNWTEEDFHLFGAKTKRLLARLHGEYSELGKNAAQRTMVGRAAFMFRKFIVPGYKKRFQRQITNEFLEDYTEGSYRGIAKFVINSTKETRALGFAAFTENWKELSPREQSNIIRGASEFGFAMLLTALSGLFLTLKGESDDDKAKYAYALGAYLTLRVKSEMLFFANPLETMTIISNPAVSVAVIENIIKLAVQMFSPTEVYERGNWKGNPKILKTIMNLTPVVKQAYKVRDIEDSLTFFIK